MADDEPSTESNGEEADVEAENNKSNALNVLIIDDSSILRRLLSEIILNRYDVSIIHAENGKAGLSFIAKLNGKIDLIFCDLDMPIMDGKTFMKHMRENEKLKEIPIICLTADTNKKTILSCIQLGAKEYIVKPYNIKDLTNKIDKFLKK
ncbi:MAG: hypothetical protein COA79_25170 [Planctomycetota bacterium]|nr:MAG: hypothetical protein COA79_25170 [Planctomycetota bacterium]